MEAESGIVWKAAAIACSLLVFVDAALESFADSVGGMRTLPIALVFAVMLLVCAAKPIGGSIALGIVWCVVFPMPVNLSMGLSLLIVLPLVTLSYHRAWWGMTLAAAVTVSRIAQLTWQSGVTGRSLSSDLARSLPWIIMPSVACVGIGVALKWLHRERQWAADDRRRLESLELAARLHDSTTNDLSYLIMCIDKLLAERHTDMGISDLSLMREVAQRALDQTHEVIAVLADDDVSRLDSDRLKTEPTKERTSCDAFAWMNDELDRRRKELSALGFHGETIMVDSPVDLNRVDEATMRLLHTLLREIFANISKHADPERGYVVAVSANGDYAHVSVADAPAADRCPSSEPTALGMGFGLPHLRQLIEEQGGTVRIRDEEGYWSLSAKIPLSHTVP
ncbi:sensor histidine kinase [Bifidobacterium eulemuris]|uniref:histidine kinase n=2 Tax=Bifidobacterium eulemuris TaxID=1765219 RepID=A0A261GC41_9BIFI|nr:hypothetical protein [Bifidobacterium eulemuris]OZG68997.1 histidine kinase [Bifidobacterium eulemuris]QOL31474.1 histidine kinase [Bifidobacterium eulemuris]